MLTVYFLYVRDCRAEEEKIDRQRKWHPLNASTESSGA